MVTDDAKEDWWLRIQSDGPKTIGPRPELIEEASSQGGISFLLMYDSEGFLKYAKELLHAQVSDNTLTEVRDLSKSSPRRVSRQPPRQYAFRAERAVIRWIRRRFESARRNIHGFPDLVAEHDGTTLGFEIRTNKETSRSDDHLTDPIYLAREALTSGQFTELTVVFVASTEDELLSLYRTLNRLVTEEMPDDLNLVLGLFRETDGFAKFVPMIETSYNEFRKHSHPNIVKPAIK